MVHQLQSPAIAWLVKVVQRAKSAFRRNLLSLPPEKALCLAPASLGEAFAVQPDDDPAVGQQGVVQLKLLDILEPAVGHADMSETQLASSMTGS